MIPTRRLLPLISIFCITSLSQAESRPNIVLMISDDQSWDGLSVAMHPDFAVSKSQYVQTPHTEKLAAAGMKFSAAYAPAPVCSPTRASLQTGKSPAQLGWGRAGPAMTEASGYKLIPPPSTRSISQNETTIGELLQKAGYATAHYGKWHIDGGGPAANGYDESDGNTNNFDAEQYKDPNPVDIFGMANKAATFMGKSHSAKKPFFIQLSFNALHIPENANASSIQRVRDRVTKAGERMRDKDIQRIAIAEDLDAGVGKVLATLEKLGLSENTYVIYMSDNGGYEQPEGGLNGKKGSVWERGIRIPFIVRGPNVPANSWSHEPVIGYDLFNTFCEIAEIKEHLPKGVEGGSLLATFHGKKNAIKRPSEELVFHFPHYQNDFTPHSSIILGEMKLIKFYETGELKLFNLTKDITESNNLAKELPEQANMLSKRLDTYLQKVGGKTPVINPSYDPNKPPMTRKKGRPGKKRMQNSQ